MYYGEKLNSITHLIGAVLALVGFGALLTVSIQHRDPWMIVSFSVFGVTLVALYTCSTLYHSFKPPALKRLFQKLDHAAIYLLIAGTYTPYMLVSLRESSGPLILAAVWGLAIVGILLDTLKKERVELLQIGIYLLMGWLVVVDFENLKLAISSAGVNWLIAGGLAYTLGVTFYVLDNKNRMRHAHGIWHVFVLLGSITHFVSILVYVR
ncbi:MAG: hemolysin III family protein [Pseudomonadales bacterium]